MGTERRKQFLLSALVVVLAFVIYRALIAPNAASGSAGSPSDPRPASQARGAASQAVAAPDVHLEALNSERPKPLDADRNLFRFKQKAPPPPSASMRSTAPSSAMPAIPVAPAGPPPPPPITLKFIGVVERGGNKPKIALLSDGQGPPMYGVEGGTVGGRYKIWRIGVESIELSYLDGRGRQTIRLSGS